MTPLYRLRFHLTMYLLTATFMGLMLGCSSLPELVLDDTAFLNDMVRNVLRGRELLIGPEDLEEIDKLLLSPLADHRKAGILLSDQSKNADLIKKIPLFTLDPHPEVAAQAREIILKEANIYLVYLLNNLNHHDVQVRRTMLNLLKEIDSPSLPFLLVSLFGSNDKLVRESAAQAFAQTVPSRHFLLNEALEDEDTLIRGTALTALAWYDDPVVISILIEAFMDADSEVRSQAKFAASRLKSKALPALHRTALQLPAPYELRLASLEVVQGIHSPESLPTLLLLLEDPDKRIRNKVGTILEGYGPETIPALSKMYSEAGVHEINLRLHILRLLGNINDEEALPVLISAILDTDPAVEKEALRGLESLGPRAHEALMPLLNQKDEKSQEAALQLLLNDASPRLYEDIEGINSTGMLLLFKKASPQEIRDYLIAIAAPASYRENIGKLKEAWDLAEEYLLLKEEIDSGKNPYLQASRKQELLSVQSRLVLKESFDLLHSYSQTQDPTILKASKETLAESRILEEEAREQKTIMMEMSQEIRDTGEKKFQRYREIQEILTLTWEHTIAPLLPLAQKVYAERNIDPESLALKILLIR